MVGCAVAVVPPLAGVADKARGGHDLFEISGVLPRSLRYVAVIAVGARGEVIKIGGHLDRVAVCFYKAYIDGVSPAVFGKAVRGVGNIHGVRADFPQAVSSISAASNNTMNLFI